MQLTHLNILVFLLPPHQVNPMLFRKLSIQEFLCVFI